MNLFERMIDIAKWDFMIKRNVFSASRPSRRLVSQFWKSSSNPVPVCRQMKINSRNWVSTIDNIIICTWSIERVWPLGLSFIWAMPLYRAGFSLLLEYADEFQDFHISSKCIGIFLFVILLTIVWVAMDIQIHLSWIIINSFNSAIIIIFVIS